MFRKIGLASILASALLFSPAAAQQIGNQPRTVHLNPPEGFETSFHGAQRTGTIIIRDEFEAPYWNLSVIRLSFICEFANIFASTADLTYTVYVKTTPTIPRTRLKNFNTECNFGQFNGDLFLFPPTMPSTALFEEPIVFEIVVEADDGKEENVFPFADFVLRGVD